MIVVLSDCVFKGVLGVCLSLRRYGAVFELADLPCQHWNFVWNHVILVPAIYVSGLCLHQFANFEVFGKFQVVSDFMAYLIGVYPRCYYVPYNILSIYQHWNDLVCPFSRPFV